MPPKDDDEPDEDRIDDQRLVRLPRRRKGSAAEIDVPAAAPAVAPPVPAPPPIAPPEPSVMMPAPVLPVPAPAVAPSAPWGPPAPAYPSPVAVDPNVFFLFEETLKLFPSAGQSIAVERMTGTPAQWMLSSRPRTANELYAEMKKLHGRREETTYKITFQDSAGHGSCGQVSMASTLDELPPAPPPVPNPYAYAPAPALAPYAPPVAPPPAAYPAPPAAAPLDMTALLTMQRQLFDMMKSMQAPPAAIAQPAAPPPVAPAPAPAPPPAPADPTSTLLAIQKQMFDMMQAIQGAAAGHAPPPPPAPPAPVVATPAQAPMDPTAALLAMQKQQFDMMITLMQAAQRAVAPAREAPFRPAYPPRDARDPREPGAPAYGLPPYQQPSARPRTPSEELRDAVSVVRSTFEVAREFGGFGGAPEPEPPEEDDSPVRVISMGSAKGVINKSDGTLRGFETLMANLPDIIKGVNDVRTQVVKERRENRERAQQQLPPGYVLAGPDYQPPEGFVAIPEVPPQAAPQSPLPEPPAEMPPPLAKDRPPPAWGMPPRPGQN